MRQYLAFCIILALLYNSTAAYKAKFLNISMCKNPDPPKDPHLEEKVIGTLDSYMVNGKMLISGNISILRDINDAFARFRGTVLKPGQPFKYIVDFGKFTCKNVLVKGVYALSKIKYDPVTCVIKKGEYRFKNYDLTKLDKMVNFIPIRGHGLNLWYFGIYTKDGTGLCYDMHVIIS